MSTSSLSNELEKEITLATTHGITSVQNLDVSNIKLELALLTETNTLAKDLQHVVYELRKLLADHCGNTNTNDNKLIHSANSLAKIVNELQVTLTTGVANTKTQLVVQLAKLPQEADNLSDFIKNSSDEHDNTKVLHILNDFLTAVSKIKIRNNLEEASMSDIYKTLEVTKKHKIETLNKIQNNDKQTYNELIHVARRSIEQMNDVTQAVDDDAETFEGNARKILRKAAENITDGLNKLGVTIYDSSDNSILKSAMLISICIIYKEFDELLQIVDNSSDDFDIRTRLHNSIYSAGTDALGCGYEYIRDLDKIVAQQK